MTHCLCSASGAPTGKSVLPHGNRFLLRPLLSEAGVHDVTPVSPRETAECSGLITVLKGQIQKDETEEWPWRWKEAERSLSLTPRGGRVKEEENVREAKAAG